MSSNPSQPSLQSTPSMAHRSQSTPFPPGGPGADNESSISQRPTTAGQPGPGQPGQYQLQQYPCPCTPVYPSQKCCPLCCSPVQQGAIFHSPFCPCVRARQHPIPYGQPGQPGQPGQYPPLAGGQQQPSSMGNNPGQYSYQSPQIGAGYPQPSTYNQIYPNSNGRPMTAPAPGSGSSGAYPSLQGPPNSRDADLHAPITRYWLEQNLPHYMKQMELQGIFRSCYCHTNPGPPELQGSPSASSMSSSASSARPDSQTSIASSMVAQPSSSQHHPSSVASSHGGYGGQHGQGHPQSLYGPGNPSQNPSMAGSLSMAPTNYSQNPDISSKGVIQENTPLSGDIEEHQSLRNRHGQYPSKHRQPSVDSSNVSSSIGDPSISSSNMSSSTRDPSVSSSMSSNPSGYSSSTYGDPSVSSSVSSSIAPSQAGTDPSSSMAPTNYDPSTATSRSQLGNPSVGPQYQQNRPIELKCFPHQMDPNALICYRQQQQTQGPQVGPQGAAPGPAPTGMNFYCYPQPPQYQQYQGPQGQPPSSSMSVATSHGGQHGYHGQGHPGY